MASKGRPKKYHTEEERQRAHLAAMAKYAQRKLNGEPIRPYGVMTEEEKYESHRLAMKRYQIKRSMKK